MKVIQQLLGLVIVAAGAYGLWVLAVLVLVFWWEGRDPLASCEGQVEHHVVPDHNALEALREEEAAL